MQILMESVIDVYPALNTLIKEYFAKTVASEDCLPLDMDWDFYINLETKGQLTLITARDNNKALLGFAMYLVGPHPQHKGKVVATCNTLATRLDKRKQGIGTSLVKAAEAYFKHIGASAIFHGYRTVYNANPLFTKMGFKLVEHFYMKVL